MYKLCLVLVVLGLSILGCDTPVQTEQKLDSWQNLLITTSPHKRFYNPSCSPDGKNIVFAGEQRVTLIQSLEAGQVHFDSIYSIEKYPRNWPDVPRLSPDGTHLLYRTYNDSILIEDMTTRRTTTIAWYNFTSTALPQWSHDGQYIYFKVSDQFINLLHKDGSPYNRVQTSHLFKHINSIHLSPDNNRLVLSASGNGPNSGYNIFTLDVSSGQSTQYTHSQRNSLMAKWSPDGQSIAYFQHDNSGSYRLVRLNVTDQSADTLGQMAFPDISWPHWSNNSNRIVFWGDPADDDMSPGIYQYTFTSESIEYMLYNSSGKRALISLDPRDDTIVLQQSRYTKQWLYSLNRDGHINRIIACPDREPTFPFWSTDGLHILYGSNYNLNQIPAQGGTPEAYTSELQSKIFQADLSPNGDFLLCHTNYHYNDTIHLKTFPDLMTITTIDSCVAASWAPDGKHFVCMSEDSLFIYQFDGHDNVTKLYSYYQPDLVDVEWSPIASNHSILYQYYDRLAGNMTLAVCDDQLNNHQKIISEQIQTACWMANGADLLYYDYYCNIYIKRVFSDF